MKIILKKQVENLGTPGDVVEVKPGYARNFLIPSGVAVIATKSNLKMIEAEKQILDHRHEREKSEAQELAAKLSEVSVTAAVQVGEEDKVFGAVTSQEIGNLLKEQGYELDRRKIVLQDPIKALGVYDVSIKIHPEVEATIKVWVVRE